MKSADRISNMISLGYVTDVQIRQALYVTRPISLIFPIAELGRPQDARGLRSRRRHAAASTSRADSRYERSDYAQRNGTRPRWPRLSTIRFSRPSRRSRPCASSAPRPGRTASRAYASIRVGAALCPRAGGSSVMAWTVIGFPARRERQRDQGRRGEAGRRQGAKEVDMVINIGAAKAAEWKTVEGGHSRSSEGGGKRRP